MYILQEKEGYNKKSVMSLLKQNTGLTLYLEHELCVYTSIFLSISMEFCWCFLAGLYKIPALFFC